MANDLVNLSYVVTNLAAGRNPTAVSGYDPSAVTSPLSATSGVSIAMRMSLLVLPCLRINPFGRTCYVDPSIGSSGSLTVTIDGDDVTVARVSPRADFVAAIVAAINADVTVGAKVTADSYFRVEDGAVEVRIRGKVGTDYYSLNPLTYSITYSVTGTVTADIYADAEYAEMSLWWKPAQNPIGGAVDDQSLRSIAWRQIAAPTSTGLATYAIGTGGMALRMDCSGALNIAATLNNISGVTGDHADTVYLAQVDLTPCSAESTS